MSKTILMLGCGPMQAVAINCAKEKGWTVIGVDGNPEAVSKYLCDQFEPIDLKNIDELVQFAQRIQNKFGLDGVFTAATDFSYAVARIAEACSLPGHSTQSALQASDKLKMRSCFEQHKVPSPAWVEINESNLEDYEKELAKKNLELPLVVKPADNMGARGCKKVDSRNELLPAINEALPYSRTGRVIVEQYMPGKEFSLEALVFDGTIILTGLADRHIFFPPYFIEMGHTIPSDCDKKDREDLIDVFYRGIKALGLTHGVAKGDIKLTPQGAMVGEIAARLSGGYMSGWTYPYSSGLIVTEKALELAVGLFPKNLSEPISWVSAERAWISIPGTISHIAGLEKARLLPFVKNVLPRYRVGDSVGFPRNNVEKCGNCISQAPTRDEAILFCEKAINEIFLRLKPYTKETDSFLNSENQEAKYFPPSFFDLPPLIMPEHTQFDIDFDLYIPIEIQDNFDTARDWYGRTLRHTLKKALEIEPSLHSFLLEAEKTLQKKAWNAFLRGGIQGIVYIYDCQNS